MDREYAGAWRTILGPNVPKSTESVLFVGEDNPLSQDARDALYPYPPRCSGERLCNHILELPTANYLACWRTNLCVGKWNRQQARDRSDLLTVPLAPWHTIVLLGKKVAEAFSFCGQPFEMRRYMNPTTGSEYMWNVLYLPHPSGRNLIWNGPGPRANARDALRALVPDLWSEPTS
jgi:hypothetical protein